MLAKLNLTARLCLFVTCTQVVAHGPQVQLQQQQEEVVQHARPPQGCLTPVCLVPWW